MFWHNFQEKWAVACRDGVGGRLPRHAGDEAVESLSRDTPPRVAPDSLVGPRDTRGSFVLGLSRHSAACRGRHILRLSRHATAPFSQNVGFSPKLHRLIEKLTDRKHWCLTIRKDLWNLLLLFCHLLLSATLDFQFSFQFFHDQYL